MTDQDAVPVGSGGGQDVGVLAFAGEMAAFRQHLDQLACSLLTYPQLSADLHISRSEQGCAVGHLALAFRVLLDSLTAGDSYTDAVKGALSIWRRAESAAARQTITAYAHYLADCGRQVAQEQVSLTVECPYCGAAPRARCRTTSPRRAETSIHKARFQLAQTAEG